MKHITNRLYWIMFYSILISMWSLYFILLIFGFTTYAFDTMSLFFLSIILLDFFRNKDDFNILHYCLLVTSGLLGISIRTLTSLFVLLKIVEVLLLITLLLGIIYLFRSKALVKSIFFTRKFKGTTVKLTVAIVFLFWFILPFFSGRNIFVLPHITSPVYINNLNWYYDSEHVFFTADIPNNQYLYRANISERKVESISLSFSPDYLDCSLKEGQIILVSSEKDVNVMWLFDVGSNEFIKLRDGEKSSYYSSKWSPDGKQIVFREKKGDKVGLYLLSLDRNKTEILPLVESKEIIRPPIEWSPDGGKIAYVQNTDKGYSLFIIEPQKRNIPPEIIVPSLETGYFTWTPNGNAITFARERKNIVDVYNIDVNTHQTNLLFSVKGQTARSFSWLPNGKFLYFELHKNILAMICQYDTVNNKVKFISPVFDLNFDPQISPDGTKLSWYSVFINKSHIFYKSLQQ